jgi:lipid-binding SYLF domain-containing protein
MKALFVSLLAIVALGLAGCESTGGESEGQLSTLSQRSQMSLKMIQDTDPSVRNLISSGYAYAIFPSVGEAAVGIGGAGGKGVVYQNGQPIGWATLNQGSLGIQLGGETYAELIIFQTPDALSVFKNGNLGFGADATATLVKAGGAAAGQFNNGTRVFVLPKGGLMAGVAITGQKFNFTAGSIPNGM